MVGLEGDRNRNCKALTRNLPGIRYPGLVPGSPYFELPGSCFGSCLQPFSIFLVTPGSRGLIPGKDQEVPGKDQEVPGKDQEVPGIWPGISWFYKNFLVQIFEF